MMILVLIISLAIAFGVRDWISGRVVAFVVLLNVSVVIVQKIKAEKTTGRLKTFSESGIFLYARWEIFYHTC